ncbi:hypothetical protein EMCRGX_G003852 [Ephydatia muelleri]
MATSEARVRRDCIVATNLAPYYEASELGSASLTLNELEVLLKTAEEEAQRKDSQAEVTTLQEEHNAAKRQVQELLHFKEELKEELLCTKKVYPRFVRLATLNELEVLLKTAEAQRKEYKVRMELEGVCYPTIPAAVTNNTVAIVVGVVGSIAAILLLVFLVLLFIDAQKYLLLFLQVSQVDHELLQATALKIVFDLLHLFGFEAYAAPDHQSGDDEGVVFDDHPLDGDVNGEPIEKATSKCDDLEGHNKTTQKIVGILADFLDGENQLLCSVAAEGLAKLFLSGRIMSQKLLARLLLLWYSPNCEDDDHLRGVLGVFFPAFAAGKRSHRESLGEIFTQVLEMILEADPSASYAGIKTSNVVDFLLQLTKPVQNEDSVHDSLAVAVGNKVLADPANVVNARLYCRALSLMEFTPSNKLGAADLQLLLSQLEHHVADKTSLRYLKKVGASLQKINPTQVNHRARHDSNIQLMIENELISNCKHLGNPNSYVEKRPYNKKKKMDDRK